jgi:HK97 gp10 family phage protein
MATGTSFTFTWHGTNIAAQLEAAIEAGMEETAQAAEGRAKELARVDTGEMRDSIEAVVEHVGNGRRIVLSVGTDHGLFNEIGTSRMPAQPMIRPAADAEFPKLPARVRANLGSLR